MSESVIRARRLVTGDGGVVENAELIIDGDRIVRIRRGQRTDDQLAGWLVPGFVDTHCHGALGQDFGQADAAGLDTIIRYHRDHGTTTLIGSLISAPLPQLERRLQALPRDLPGLVGVHLEGPFLSRAKCGAHDPAVLAAPDDAAVGALLDAGSGILKMITLAPELPGAMAAVRDFTEAGVRVAFGHSDGDAATAELAVRQGVRVATHLCNAMRPIHHREPGPVPVLLTNSHVTVELIADGQHLADEVLQMAVAAAGPDRVSLISDAAPATGLPDGSYRFGPVTTQVINGLARVRDRDGGLGSIAGATCPLDVGFARLVGLGYSIPDVALMASTTPARTHGLTDAGRLAPGQFADAVLVDNVGRRIDVLWRGRWQVSAQDGL